MRKSFYKQLYKEYGISGMVLLVGLVFLFGGIGALFVERAVLPRLSTWPVFKNFQTFQTNSPVVITKREEVRIVEGVNQQEVVGNIKESLVLIYLHQGDFDSGGFRIDSSFPGTVATSDWLILVSSASLRPGFQITVLTQDGSVYDAELVSEDSLTGIAFLKIDAEGLQVLRNGFSEDLASGEKVFIVYPDENLSNPSFVPATLTNSPLLSPSLLTSYSLQRLNITLDTDIDLQDRHMGAAVVNKDAQLVGFVTRTLSEMLIVRGEDVRATINNYLDDGEVDWPRLNLTYQFLSETQTKLFGLPARSGILVKDTVNQLRSDDFVFAVNGSSITDRAGFQELLFSKNPGVSVDLRLIRDGAEREVELDL